MNQLREYSSINAKNDRGSKSPHWLLSWLLILFLMLEYARPLVLAQFKLQAVIIIINLPATRSLGAKDAFQLIQRYMIEWIIFTYDDGKRP